MVPAVQSSAEQRLRYIRKFSAQRHGNDTRLAYFIATASASERWDGHAKFIRGRLKDLFDGWQAPLEFSP